MREKGKISIMAKVFANTLAIYLACLEYFANVPTCSSQYWYWVMSISPCPQLLCMKKLENQICVDFA